MEDTLKFNKPVMDLIRHRSSWRSYRGEMLEDDVIRKLVTFLSARTVGPMGSNMRFQLITASNEDREALKDLGTYGFIKGTVGFIVGAVKPNRMNLEDYGYLMEEIILFATDHGLGTCWLGGTFKKSRFAEKIEIRDDELVPAVSPVGYIADKRSTRERIVRWGAGSKKRLPWEKLFFTGTFDEPMNEVRAGTFKEPLEMVRLGPSASNKQPWRIVKEKDEPVFHFYMQRSKGYSKNQERFNTVDLQRLDMGIAMCHWEHTMAELGLEGEWLCNAPAGITQPPLTEYVVSWQLPQVL
jgi:nitroreductase